MSSRWALWKNSIKFNIKKRNVKTPDPNSWRGKSLAVLQKFGRGLMLPISVLPFAGILLGIGGALQSNLKDSEAAQVIASILMSMSNVVFANLSILFCVAIVITFTKEAGSAAFMAIIGYLVFTAAQSVFIHYDKDGNFVDIFWFHKNENLKYIVGQNLGIRSLTTSLFGGVIIGALVAYLYNKFKYIQLPNAIGFFSGVRFIPFVMIPTCFVVGTITSLLWPWIGDGINYIGTSTSKAPAGLDGLVYGMFTRALMPFGLHQIFISMAYQTSLGGYIDINTIDSAANAANLDENIKNQIIDALKEFSQDKNVLQGDQQIWNFINTLPFNSINGIPVYDWFEKYANVNAGHFMQDYPTYLGTCMGLGTAMILAADKDKRKVTASVIGSAMGVAFLTGITEPLEFSFLFIAPLFYYLFYVPMSGLSYMFMNLAHAHVGTGFARGFIDLIIYGALPVLKGTGFYWALVIAVPFGLITFLCFYVYIVKFNIATPGRLGNDVVLITKQKYNEFKANKLKSKDQRLNDIVHALGGLENIINCTACATRLRLEVKDINNVNLEKLKMLGAAGTSISGNNIQVIFGNEAIVLAEKINNLNN